jgi:hypothetical protein
MCLKQAVFGLIVTFLRPITSNGGGNVQVGRVTASWSFPPMAILAIVGGGLLILSAVGLAASAWSMLDFGADPPTDSDAANTKSATAVPRLPPVDDERLVPFDLFEDFERMRSRQPAAAPARPGPATGAEPGVSEPGRAGRLPANSGASQPDADIPRNAEPPPEGRGPDAATDRQPGNARRAPGRETMGETGQTVARNPAPRPISRPQPYPANARPAAGTAPEATRRQPAPPPARPAPAPSGGLRLSRSSGVIGFGSGDVLVSRCGADGPEPAALIQEALDAARESGVPACLNVIRGGSAQSNVAVRVRPGE